MFNFSKDNISGIHFIFLKVEDICSLRKSLTPRFNNPKTLPGTRRFNLFHRIQQTLMSRASEQEGFNLAFKLTDSIQYLQEIRAGKYSNTKPTHLCISANTIFISESAWY